MFSAALGTYVNKTVEPDETEDERRLLRRIPRPRSSMRSKAVTTDAGEIHIIEEDVEM